VAYIPVIRADLVGAQTPEVEKARSYRTPLAARRSRFGVRATGLP
jgi:hypothetical protein